MLTHKQEESVSKFMSKLLRHEPGQFGLTLDPEGFCELEDLLRAIQGEPRWRHVAEEDLRQVVRNCPKQRYHIAGASIRANYGHSVDRLQYPESAPPSVLYHGTNMKVVQTILNEGLKPMGRKYVHLSESVDFASLAGRRRGELVLLQTDTEAARQAGIAFYKANHGVWLADQVPGKFLSRLNH